MILDNQSNSTAFIFFGFFGFNGEVCRSGL